MPTWMHGSRSLGFDRPVVAPVIGPKIAPVDAGGLLDGNALVRRRLAARHPVADGLGGLVQLARQSGSAACGLDCPFNGGLTHAPIVHVPCTPRQCLVTLTSHTLCMDDVFARVDREFDERARKHIAPADWYALGKIIGVSRQTMWNWKDRKKVPPASYQAVADALGWTADRLLGRDEPSRGSRGDPDTPSEAGNNLPHIVAVRVTLSHAERVVIERLLKAAELFGIDVEVTQWTLREHKTGLPGRRAGDAKAPVSHEPASLKLVKAAAKKGKGK